MLNPSVHPIWIDNAEEVQQALLKPVQQVDQKIYLTKCPEAANKLVKEKLPCIFVEAEHSRSVQGADLIFLSEGPDPVLDPDLLCKTWQRHYGLPWLITETERLIIRETVMEDLPAFLKMYGAEAGNPDVVPLTENPEAELAAYIQYRYPFYGYGVWSLVEKESGQVIGRAGFQEYEAKASREMPETRIEIAYLIAEEFRRQGFAEEAVKAILEFGKQELELTAVYLRTSEENQASQGFAKKLGFQSLNGREYLLTL